MSWMVDNAVDGSSRNVAEEDGVTDEEAGGSSGDTIDRPDENEGETDSSNVATVPVLERGDGNDAGVDDGQSTAAVAVAGASEQSPTNDGTHDCGNEASGAASNESSAGASEQSPTNDVTHDGGNEVSGPACNESASDDLHDTNESPSAAEPSRQSAGGDGDGDGDGITEEEGEGSSSDKQDRPPPKFDPGERVLAKDSLSGILYESIIRRRMYSPRNVQSVQNELYDAAKAAQDAMGVAADNAQDVADADDDNAEDRVEWCWHYFVHYQKWNVKWDRWVEEREVLEYNDETKEMAKKLKVEITQRFRGKGKKKKLEQIEEMAKKKALEEEQKRAAAAAAAAARQESGGKRKRGKTQAQRLREVRLCEQDLVGERNRVPNADRLPLPFILKRLVVDEWEIITCRAQLDDPSNILRMVPVLPAKISIDEVLDKYLESKLELCKEEGDEEKRDQWKAMVRGIATLFNQSLPHQLLYPQERPQHDLFFKNDYDEEVGGPRRKSAVYGCEHLLRLIVKLPTLLARSDLAKADVVDISSKMGDFVRFLQRHKALCFAQVYREPTGAELTTEERQLKRQKGSKVQVRTVYV